MVFGGHGCDVALFSVASAPHLHLHSAVFRETPCATGCEMINFSCTPVTTTGQQLLHSHVGIVFMVVGLVGNSCCVCLPIIHPFVRFSTGDRRVQHDAAAVSRRISGALPRLYHDLRRLISRE